MDPTCLDGLHGNQNAGQGTLIINNALAVNAIFHHVSPGTIPGLDLSQYGLVFLFP